MEKEDKAERVAVCLLAGVPSRTRGGRTEEEEATPTHRLGEAGMVGRVKRGRSCVRFEPRADAFSRGKVEENKGEGGPSEGGVSVAVVVVRGCRG